MQPFPRASYPGPLDYPSSAALMNDPTFRGRIKVALLKFAVYIQGEASTVTAHNTRIKWAQQCVVNSDMWVQQVAPAVVMDANVQTNGDSITDALLQTAVEETMNAQM